MQVLKHKLVLVGLVLALSGGFFERSAAHDRGAVSGADQLKQFEAGSAAYVSGEYEAAVELWAPLADQGDAAAQFLVGAMTETGEGVRQDYAAAGRWYRKAADQGNASAQYNLGMLYTKGLGVPRGYVQAHKWFNLSAAGGYGTVRVLAEMAQADLAAKMTSTQIAEAQRMASEWHKK